MKRLIKDALMYIALGLVIWGLVAVFSVPKSIQVATIAYKAFANAFWIIISVFFFIGLIQAWVTPEQMSKYLGKSAGWKRFAFASTVPILLGGSLFTMLPLTKSLKEKGASNSAILAFLTAWSGKAPLIPLEAQFLGWKFTIIRTLLIIPTAIIMGLLGEAILDRWEGVPVKVDLGKMAEGEILVGESIVEELDKEYNLINVEAGKLVSKANHRVEFNILGDILEKNIPLKLAELASKYDYDIVKLEVSTPQLNFSNGSKKFPSKAKFILVTKSKEDVSEHLDKIRELLNENDIKIASEKEF
jgi:uncharacterized membrane protein YraQ (UPF0718 family)